MPEFRHTLIRERAAVAASDRVLIDLPNDPLSFLYLTIEAQQAATGTPASLAQMLDTVSLINLTFKGASSLTITGRDAAVLAAMHGWGLPVMNNWADLTDQRLRIDLPLSLGRFAYRPDECFPAVNRGDLQLYIEWAAAFAPLTAVTYTLMACELPGAAPERFMKAVRKTMVAATTGEFRADLPIANPLLGVLLFSPTVPAATALTTTIDKVELLADNVERYIAAARWQQLNAALARRIPLPYAVAGHQHVENLTPAYTQNASTAPGIVSSFIAQYGLVDLDPNRDGQFALATAGLASLDLNITFGDTGAMRYYPLELVQTTRR